MVGILNLVALWPVVITLYYTGLESIQWGCLPWTELCAAAALSLGECCHSPAVLHMIAVANLLANLGILVTYELFITLGLIAAVPASALYDVRQHSVNFTDMKVKVEQEVEQKFAAVLQPCMDSPNYVQ